MVAEHFTMLSTSAFQTSPRADKQEFGGGFQNALDLQMPADMAKVSHMTDRTITSYLFVMLPIPSPTGR